MIPLREQEQLRRYFQAQLPGQVRLEHFTERERGIYVPGREPCPTSKPARRMVEELAALSPLLRLRLYDFYREPQAAARWGVDKVPATVVHNGRGRSLKLYGTPGGYLFPAFIEILRRFSQGESGLPEELGRRLRRLGRAAGPGGLGLGERPFSLRLFVAGDSPHCPGMLLAMGMLALSSHAQPARASGPALPDLRVEVLEASEFPRLVQAHNIHSVPVTIIDERVTILGAVSLEAIVEQLWKLAQSPILAPGPLPSGPSSPFMPGPPGHGALSWEAAPAGGRLVLRQTPFAPGPPGPSRHL
ncbi:MAG TPA: hypothetical protein VJM69_07010 [Dehalococcoidia bacterium]|nr:hypothetical protein [Dehalococcoidia bacterium]